MSILIRFEVQYVKLFFYPKITKAKKVGNDQLISIQNNTTPSYLSIERKHSIVFETTRVGAI